MSILRDFLDHGQSIWYDNISRGLLNDGTLAAMVKQGLAGVTSNPTIFEKAILGSNDYREQLDQLRADGKYRKADEIIQELMIRDIQLAADVLRSVYDRSSGHDGFVSIEVNPRKARDTNATIEEARYLWNRVNRPNLMVKIPATVEGLPAIEQMLYEGININVTLLFSVDRYRAVAEAYLRAIERRIVDNKRVDLIASVASVFVSRIDTKVDGLIEKQVNAGNSALASFKGTAAIANTKMVYQAFKRLFTSERFSVLAGKGAMVQRPLWASTGTKNPAYSDLLYVEPLVGGNTVNTVPPATYDAILDHAKPIAAIERNMDEARSRLDTFAANGIDMNTVTHELEVEGVASFEKSFDGLLKYLSV